MPDDDAPKTFRPESFPMELRLPAGTEYVEADTLEQIRNALAAGRAVYAEGCEGKAFVWPAGEGYLADHFYAGRPRPHRFETLQEAADFAAGLCE
jgi:hypothetical protein